MSSFSRLGAACISFQGSDAALNLLLNPLAFILGVVATGVAAHDESTLEWPVQLGSLKFPESPAPSIPESYPLLRQTCDMLDNSTRTINTDAPGYAANSFALGIPFQLIIGRYREQCTPEAGGLSLEM